jgi:hypothetical protein
MKNRLSALVARTDMPLPPMQTQLRTSRNARFAASVSAAFLLLSLVPARAQTELITDGSFELFSPKWISSGGAGIYTSASVARTGTNFLYLGVSVSETDATYQTISIPSASTNAVLTFYYNISSTEGTLAVHDIFTASIRDTNGVTLATVGSWSNVNQDPGSGNPYYHQMTFNLLPYAGQTVRVYFSSTNDASNPTHFYIDDVSVQVILGPPTNDICATAIGLSAGITYLLNTTNATSGGDPTPACQGSFGKGVWYTFTPFTSGTVTISTCSSDFDTVLAVYTGSCASLTNVACNDNNGPACAANQASVSFAGTAGTAYFILAGGAGGATGNLAIVPTFDSTITNDPQAITIESTINAAIALYQSSFSDPVIVTVTFAEMGSGRGLNITSSASFSYSNYRAALASHATSADDSVALAHLPNSTNNPVNGNLNVQMSYPLARTVGFSANPPPGAKDSTLYLNTSVMNLSVTASDHSKFSLFSTVCHEIDEILGMNSALDGLTNGAPAPTGSIGPEDLFRYDQFGARSFTTDINAASYFSLDGTTDLARFNQHQGGDYQDWYSFYGGQVPQVQDAYTTGGTAPVPGVELRVLDALGYTRVVTPSPSLSLTRSGTNAVISWPAAFVGFTLQSATNLGPQASWTKVTNLPVTLGSRYNVTNLSTASASYYRLVK